MLVNIVTFVIKYITLEGYRYLSPRSYSSLKMKYLILEVTSNPGGPKTAIYKEYLSAKHWKRKQYMMQKVRALCHMVVPKQHNKALLKKLCKTKKRIFSAYALQFVIKTIVCKNWIINEPMHQEEPSSQNVYKPK